MCATISTWPLLASCTTAVTSPRLKSGLLPGKPPTGGSAVFRGRSIITRPPTAGSSQPDLDAMRLQVRLGGEDRVDGIVEDRGGQGRIGTAFAEHGAQMLRFAGTAAGDDRYSKPGADSPRELEVIAVLGAVPVHAGEEDLTGTALRGLPRPGQHITTRVAAPPVGVDMPAVTDAPGVDGDDDALHPEALRRIPDQLGPLQGRRVQRDLVGAAAGHPRDGGEM